MIDKERIRNFKIFSTLDPEELESILQIARQIEYKSGDIILEEDDAQSKSDFFLILKGMVKVELDTIQLTITQGSSKRLAVLKDGEIFGEVGLLRGTGRSARVVAYSDVTALQIDRSKLYSLLEANSRLGYNFMKNLAVILSERLVDVNFMWRDVS